MFVQLYDQQTSHKKTLLPKIATPAGDSHGMVQQSLFDIYLCDFCEAELYSMDAYKVSDITLFDWTNQLSSFSSKQITNTKLFISLQEHERVCRGRDSESDNSDIIVCGSEKFESEPEVESEPEDVARLQSNFLQMFQLTTAADPLNMPMEQKMLSPQKRIVSSNHSYNKSHHKKSARQLDVPLQPDKIRRQPRRANASVMLAKCPQIPISSPAGQRVVNITKVCLADNYQRERIDRYERFCAATVLASDGTNRPKFMDRSPPSYPSTYRSPHPKQEYVHVYKHPRRQFRRHLRDADVAKYQRILLQQNKCKPLIVRTNKLTAADIEGLQAQVKRPKISPPENVVAFIDLCSEPDEEELPLTLATTSSEAQANMHRLAPVPPMQLMQSGSLPPPPTSTSTSYRPGPLNPQIRTITQRTVSHTQTTRNWPVFVDCSIVNETITVHTDTILQTLITNSEPISYIGNELQQNKENRLVEYITDQVNTQAAMISSVNPFPVDFTMWLGLSFFFWVNRLLFFVSFADLIRKIVIKRKVSDLWGEVVKFLPLFSTNLVRQTVQKQFPNECEKKILVANENKIQSSKLMKPATHTQKKSELIHKIC